MKVFCPNCGSDNDGMAGGRVTCRACTATFEVPRDSAGPAPAAAPFPGQTSPPQQPFQQPVQPQFQQPPSAAPAAGWVQAPPNPQVSSFPSNQPAISTWAQPQAAAQTNTLAIISLIAGILCCVPFASIAAAIMGAVALKQINESSGAQKGKELALIGLILGALGTLGTVAYIILAIAGSVR